MSASCSSECKWKNFGFINCEPHRFYKSQCGNQFLFVIYRGVFFFYALGWIVADIVVNREDSYPIYLTNWTEATGCIYFGVAFAVSLYGLTSFAKEPSDLKWFHRLQWILFNVSFPAALVTDLLFWTALSNVVSYEVLVSGYNIQSHAINFLMLCIDLFVSCFPIRVLHFIYPMGYGLVYTLFTLILYWSNTRAAVYSLLNWAKNPGLAIGLSLGASFVALPLCHVIAFGLFHLRELIYRRCCKANNQGNNPSNSIQMEEANFGFE